MLTGAQHRPKCFSGTAPLDAPMVAGLWRPPFQRQRLRHRGGVTPPRLYSRAFSGLEAAHGVRVFRPRCLLSAFCDSDPRCWPGGSQVERRSGLLTAG